MIKTWTKILLLLATMTTLAVFIFLNIQNSSKTTGEYMIELNENSTDTNLTDVYLVNQTTQDKKLEITLSDVHQTHYHPAEWINGNLFIIKEVTDANGQTLSELWKFTNKDGDVLISQPSIDFRVDPTGQYIAIVNTFANVSEAEIIFLDTDGNVLKTIARADMEGVADSNALRPLFWQGDDFWFQASEAADTNHLGHINVTTWQTTIYDISDFRPRPDRQE
jgi:hypothetical protein